MTASIQLRDLTTLDEFRQVLSLEKQVWDLSSGDEAIPASLLAAGVRRGGVLVGAFEPTDRLVGWVFSLPALRGRRLVHWSHALGVAPPYRNAGLGRALKLEQRDRVLRLGIDLVEWTYDPLQAVNAHLNFAKLGVIVQEYEENAYGDNDASPLWSGLPTDRFVAEWRIATPHVERRIKRGLGPPLRSADALCAEPVNAVRAVRGRLEPANVVLDRLAPRLSVVIPSDFSEMQMRDVGLARAWRLTTREIFSTYFRRGYRAVDFWLGRSGVAGNYLLTRTPEAGNTGFAE